MLIGLNNMVKKVTILTSVCNALDYLPTFFANIEKQTIYNECVHVIMCDYNDGESRKLCLDFAIKHPTVVSYRTFNEDPGIYALWNSGIRATNTPYITNANTDDQLDPQCIEKHVKLLDEKSDIDLAYCYNLCTYEPNYDIENPGRLARYPTREFSPLNMLRNNLPHNHPVWRRSLHDKNGFFDESYRSASDWEFWLRCVSNGAKFELIKEDLGYYYWNPKGVSTNPLNFSWKNKEEVKVHRMYQKIIHAF